MGLTPFVWVAIAWLMGGLGGFVAWVTLARNHPEMKNLNGLAITTLLTGGLACIGIWLFLLLEGQRLKTAPEARRWLWPSVVVWGGAYALFVASFFLPSINSSLFHRLPYLADLAGLVLLARGRHSSRLWQRHASRSALVAFLLILCGLPLMAGLVLAMAKGVMHLYFAGVLLLLYVLPLGFFLVRCALATLIEGTLETGRLTPRLWLPVTISGLVVAGLPLGISLWGLWKLLSALHM